MANMFIDLICNADTRANIYILRRLFTT